MPKLDDPFVLLLLVTLVCGVAGVGISWWPSRRRATALPGWVDLPFVLMLLGAGTWEGIRLYRLANPQEIPWGLDYNDFLGHLADAVIPAHVYGGGYRYYLFPWIAAAIVRLFDVPPYLAGLRVGLAAHCLLPMAVYALLRGLAPRPVALAGGLLLVHLPALLVGLGQLSDYPLAAVLQVAVLAAGSAAIVQGGIGAFLGLGVASALLLGATSKALPILLVALACAGPALPWTQAWEALRTPRGTPGRTRSALRLPLATLALVGPLAAMWLAYAHAEGTPRPLEFNVYQVERHYAGELGVSLAPQDYGWPPDSVPDAQGTWRVGRWEALVGLPRTLRFLLETRPGYPPAQTRIPGIRQGLADALATGTLPALFLALVGCLGVLGRPSPGRRVLAVTLLAVGIGGSFLGATRLPFVVRFFLPVLVVLPGLALAGAAVPFRLAAGPRRGGHELAFLPVPVVALLLLFLGSGPWSSSAARSRLAVFDPMKTTLASFLDLQAELRPQDEVVDVTGSAQAAALYATTARVVFGTFTGRTPPIHLPASTGGGRRFLVLCTAIHPCQEADFWVPLEAALARNPRYRVLRHGYVEDLTPGLPDILWPDYRPSPARGTPTALPSVVGPR